MDLQRLLLTAAALRSGSPLNLEALGQVISNGNMTPEVANLPREGAPMQPVLEMLARALVANQYTAHVPAPEPQPTVVESLCRILLERTLSQGGPAGLNLQSLQEQLASRCAGTLSPYPGAFSSMLPEYQRAGASTLLRPGSSALEGSLQGQSDLSRELSGVRQKQGSGGPPDNELVNSVGRSEGEVSRLQELRQHLGIQPPEDNLTPDSHTQEPGFQGYDSKGTGWYPGPTALDLESSEAMRAPKSEAKPTLSQGTWPGLDFSNLLDWMTSPRGKSLEDTANSIFAQEELLTGLIAVPSISEGSTIVLGQRTGQSPVTPVGPAAAERQSTEASGDGDKKRLREENSSLEIERRDSKKLRAAQDSTPTKQVAPPCLPSQQAGPSKPPPSKCLAPPQVVSPAIPRARIAPKPKESPKKPSPRRPVLPAPAPAPPLRASPGGDEKDSGDDKFKNGRVKRGRATDPHSFAERVRREKIAERMQWLLSFIPEAEKADKIGQFDHLIDYMKGLHHRVERYEKLYGPLDGEEDEQRVQLAPVKAEAA